MDADGPATVTTATVSFFGSPERVRQFSVVMHELTGQRKGGAGVDADGKPVDLAEPDWTLSPGTILYEVLKDREITPLELVPRSGLPLRIVDGVLDATVPIDEVIAAKLESALGVSASTWLNGERLYRAALARGAKDCSREVQER